VPPRTLRDSAIVAAEPLDTLGLAAPVHLVPDGRTGWRAYGAGPSAGIPLSAAEVAACLDPDGPAWEFLDPALRRRLIATGLLAPGDAEAQDRRDRWTAVGWGPALDFLAAMRTEAASYHYRLPRATDLAGEPIVEATEAGPRRSTLGREVYETVALPGPLRDDPNLRAVTAVLAVDQVQPGWYVDGWQARREHPDEDALSRIAPVAFGRAGFPVAALLLLFVRCDPAASTASRYAEAHVVGGIHLALVEARASEHGLPFRCNYAVSTRSLAKTLDLGAGYLSLGAVALGAP